MRSIGTEERNSDSAIYVENNNHSQSTTKQEEPAGVNVIARSACSTASSTTITTNTAAEVISEVELENPRKEMLKELDSIKETRDRVKNERKKRRSNAKEKEATALRSARRRLEAIEKERVEERKREVQYVRQKLGLNDETQSLEGKQLTLIFGSFLNYIDFNLLSDRRAQCTSIAR